MTSTHAKRTTVNWHHRDLDKNIIDVINAHLLYEFAQEEW